MFFDKQSHLPIVSITNLTLGTDYEVIVDDSTDIINVCDEIPFTIKFKGYYSGEISVHYAIAPKELTVSLTSTYTKTYDFTTDVDPDAIGDTIILSLSGLVDSDLESVSVSASSFVHVDDIGSVVLTASEFSLVGEDNVIANYYISTVSATANITVNSIDLSNATITLEDPTYTSENLEPEITVTITDVNGNSQTIPSDLYDIEFTNNIETATDEDTDAPTVTISPISDKLTGSKNKKFSILPVNIKDATIELDETLIYNGLEQTQHVKSFKVNDLDVTFEYEDNTATDVKTSGNYTLLIKGIDNFTGEVSVEFNITPYEITNDKVTITLSEEFTYAEDLGQSDKIKVQVPTTATITINSQSDYFGDSVISSDMYSIELASGFSGKYGKNTIKITLSGNYSNSVEKEYTIAPKEITLTGCGEKDYLDNDPTMYTTTGIITADKDAEILSGNLVRTSGESVGEYLFTGSNVTVNKEYQTRYTVQFVNNGEKFTINKKEVSSDNITVPESLEYDGNSKPITIAVQKGDSTYTLALGTDYTVTYNHSNETNDCTSAGSIVATITYSFNFEGTTSKEYTITKKDVSISGVSATDKVYDGTTIAEWIGDATLVGIVNSDINNAYLKRNYFLF